MQLPNIILRLRPKDNSVYVVYVVWVCVCVHTCMQVPVTQGIVTPHQLAFTSLADRQRWLDGIARLPDNRMIKSRLNRPQWFTSPPLTPLAPCYPPAPPSNAHAGVGREGVLWRLLATPYPLRKSYQCRLESLSPRNFTPIRPPNLGAPPSPYPLPPTCLLVPESARHEWGNAPSSAVLKVSYQFFLVRFLP